MLIYADGDDDDDEDTYYLQHDQTDVADEEEVEVKGVVMKALRASQQPWSTARGIKRIK